MEWDCLFLIPKPWYGPVLAPVMISLYLMLGCCVCLAHETRSGPLRLTPMVIFLQLAAMALWYWSFVKDADLVARHGYRAIQYNWWLFCAGLICAFVSLSFAVRWKGTLVGNESDSRKGGVCS
jgi:hypothetical protein